MMYVSRLDGLSATTHFRAEDELRTAAPNTTICMSERYIDNGKVITSAGISAGIDMALYTVRRLLGITCSTIIGKVNNGSCYAG
jgi:transcriptional regulator GlxA family with amidase domain